MQMEHCTGKFCHHVFVTDNYKISTCPFDEWHITVVGDLSKASSDAAKAHGRRFVSIEELMEVEVAVEARLIRPEVIAVVLYTGPMVRGLELHAPSSSSLDLWVHTNPPIPYFANRC